MEGRNMRRRGPPTLRLLRRPRPAERTLPVSNRLVAHDGHSGRGVKCVRAFWTPS